MNTVMNSTLKTVLLATGLLLGAQAQAGNLACDPRDLMLGPDNQSPAFSIQGPLLRMHGLTPDSTAYLQPVGTGADGEPQDRGTRSRSEPGTQQGQSQLNTPDFLCPPQQLAPLDSNPAQQRAQQRIWL